MSPRHHPHLCSINLCTVFVHYFLLSIMRRGSHQPKKKMEPQLVPLPSQSAVKCRKCSAVFSCCPFCGEHLTSETAAAPRRERPHLSAFQLWCREYRKTSEFQTLAASCAPNERTKRLREIWTSITTQPQPPPPPPKIQPPPSTTSQGAHTPTQTDASTKPYLLFCRARHGTILEDLKKGMPLAAQSTTLFSEAALRLRKEWDSLTPQQQQAWCPQQLA